MLCFVLFIVIYMQEHLKHRPKMNSEELNIEFLKHKDSAYRYAATLLHAPAEAEDVTQDLYERLWRRRLLVRRAGFRALVMTTVRNMCLDRLRGREAVRYEDIEQCERLAIHPRDGEDLTPIIKRLIAALPEREREVMHLHDVEGMAFEDIAEVVGSSVEAVRMACSRARQKVKEELIKFMNYGV